MPSARVYDLTKMEVAVLRHGAASSGLAGLNWTLKDGKERRMGHVGVAVAGLLRRGLLVHPHPRVGEHLETKNNAAGDAALKLETSC